MESRMQAGAGVEMITGTMEDVAALTRKAGDAARVVSDAIKSAA